MVRVILRAACAGWLFFVLLAVAALAFGAAFPGTGALTFGYNSASVWALDLRSGVVVQIQDLPLTGTLSPDGTQRLIVEPAAGENSQVAVSVEDTGSGTQRHIGTYSNGSYAWAYDNAYLLLISSEHGDDTVTFARISLEDGSSLVLGTFFAPDYGFYAHGRLVSFSPDRRYLSLQRFTSQPQPSLGLIYDLLTGVVIWEEEVVSHVAWSPGGRWIIAGGEERFTLISLEDDSTTSVGQYEGEHIGFAANAAIAYYEADAALYRLYLETGESEAIAVPRVRGERLTFAAGGISPRGRYLGAIASRTAYIFDTSTGDVFRPDVSTRGGQVSIHWHPDERTILWRGNEMPPQTLVYDLAERRIVYDISTRNPTNSFRLPTYFGWYSPP